MGALELIRDELLLFAAIGLLIGGVDELLLDLIYFGRRLWRSLFIYSRMPRMTARDLPPAGSGGPIAVFIPAWDEASVIGRMIDHCLAQWRNENVHLFVGAYPNDRATIDAVAEAAVAEGSGRITLVVNPQPGPTTKADCLNQLWQALGRWEADEGAAIAVVLHDAEDVVHADAIRLMALLAPRFAMVQLPVLPLTTRRSRWVSGHYCDEFAEAHGKALLVREAVGAGMPSAGVGCAFARDMLGRIAAERNDRPFDSASLTEDYELGLRIAEAGGRGIIVRMRDAAGGLIATREYFPDTFDAAVRQKARWTVGIALAGWDRLGWNARPGELWMRLRDRRAVLAALVLVTAYAGMALAVGLLALDLLGIASLRPIDPLLKLLLDINLALLVWRMAVRAGFVWQAYGVAEALRSVPRTIIANLIAMVAARRALVIYAGYLRGEKLRWDKTVHRFPDPDEVPA